MLSLIGRCWPAGGGSNSRGPRLGLALDPLTQDASVPRFLRYPVVSASGTCRLGYGSEVVGGEVRDRTEGPRERAPLSKREGYHSPLFFSVWWIVLESNEKGHRAAWFTATLRSIRAYQSSCASALGSGGWARTSDARINNPVDYHCPTPEPNADHAFVIITHQLSKIKNRGPVLLTRGRSLSAVLSTTV